jgi:hypothetical protein
MEKVCNPHGIKQRRDMLFCFDIGNSFQTDAGCSGKLFLRDAEISSGFNKSAGNGGMIEKAFSSGFREFMDKG